jgi:thioredoxin 1
MSVTLLNYLADFEHATSQSGLCLVDFYADWCAPCKVIAPKIDELAEHNPDVRFYKVNVDVSSDIATQEGVTAMPTFIFYKDGKRVDIVVGANLSLIKFKLEQLK